MDENIEAILSSLPDKKPRSRLEPYFELIQELRRRGRTYREIAGILASKCNLRVAVSTLHEYMRIRSESRRARNPRRPDTPVGTGEASLRQSPDALGQRIAALKAKKYENDTKGNAYEFDADKPLRLNHSERINR